MGDSTNASTSELYDVIIIGGGPAGLTAALYLARARFRVLVIEKKHFGGQITITEEVVNYPGISSISGNQLTKTMRLQAQDFGAEFLLTEVIDFSFEQDIKLLYTPRGDYSCLGVLLATGAHPRTVGFKGEEAFKGHGVAYCATCDGEFFTGKDLFVIGGGYAAAEESVFLTKFARQITILMHSDDFTCAKAVSEQAKKHPKIKVITNTSVEEVSGQDGLNYIRYRNDISGEITEFRAKEGDTFGVFVFAGYEPATSFLKGKITLNEKNYILTDENMKTNVDGIYAAGDVRIKTLRQVVTAVGDGALAATELERYVTSMQEKTGKKPTPPSARQKNDHTTDRKDSLLSADMEKQLATIFARMERPLLLKLYLDSRPVSSELKNYMETLSSLTPKLKMEIADQLDNHPDYPCVTVCLDDGTQTGLTFHGVPGGHEFTSFVIGLYNTSGPGQSLESSQLTKIQSIQQTLHLKILVSLSCTMCPDTVTAAQKIASLNPNITTDIYDINHFPALKEKYHVMSVPCIIINETQITFGRKNIEELLELLNI